MNFLVTGGAGFIGKSLVLKLSEIRNSKITVLDRNNYNFKKKNINFIKSNLENPKILKKIKNNYDYIFHLAADLGVQNVIKFPIKSFNNNIITTQTIVEISKKQKKLKRLFFFSTSEIYTSLNSSGKMSESDKIFMPLIIHPRSSYWLSKITGEFLVIHSNVPYTIFRIFNIYGENMKNTHVIPSIFKKLSEKKPTFENPSHSRCFMYINDAIDIFILSLKNAFKNQIVNIANPSEEIKIGNLVKLIQKILKNNKKTRFRNVKNMSILRRMPSIKKLESLIGRKIKFTNLKKGLNILHKFYENKN